VISSAHELPPSVRAGMIDVAQLLAALPGGELGTQAGGLCVGKVLGANCRVRRITETCQNGGWPCTSRATRLEIPPVQSS
jgi:hypothetical protein